MDKKYIIDRFEGDYAVCEYTDEDSGDISFFDIERKEIDSIAVEGDVIYFSEVEKIYLVDKKETENLKSNIADLMNELFE